MKFKKKIRFISFALVILTVIMLLPFGTITAYAAESEPKSDEILADETSTDSQNIADPPEGDEPAEPAADGVELETEVLYYEYEIENTAMPAPPMTNIGGSVDPNALELETGFLQSGVYAIENMGNDNYYMSVENGAVDSGFRVVQQNYGSDTPLTSFSRPALFKVTRVGDTNRYIIRAMTNNRMTIWSDSNINEDEMITTFIATDDANALGYTYTIVAVGSVCTIQPYGSSDVIAAPNSTASGDTNADAAQLVLTSQSAAGSRGNWRFTPYTGNIRYGHHIYRTAGMGDGLVKGKTGTIWLKTWSTVINANTPYLAIKSPSSSVATANWQANNYLATITAHKSGDYQMEIQTRIGSSTTVKHTQYTTYTVIPDIVGDTAFVQNAATGKYMEVESASKADGGIVQQWQFHTGAQAQWIFELGGGGYFKIKNVNSGKYLGVDSSDTTKVKQYSTVTDYTLWKLTETSNKSYKISCKVSTLNGKVLSVPLNTSANGADLTILSYVDDSDYKDEWECMPYLGEIHHWNSDADVLSYWESPPTVYFEDMVKNAEFDCRSGFETAIDQWEWALDMSFEMVSESNADIKIYGVTPELFVSMTGDDLPSSVLGRTRNDFSEFIGCVLYEGELKKINRVTASKIYLIYRDQDNLTLSMIKCLATHELGHALGYTGHSYEGEDIMYPEIQYAYQLSWYDISHLSQVYVLMK